MELYSSIISAARDLVVQGRSDLAVRALDVIRQNGLSNVPRGNNRCAVADSLAAGYVAAGKPDSARDILLAVRGDADEDQSSWSHIRLAIQLGRLGEKEAAKNLLAQAELQAVNADAKQQWNADPAASQFLSIATAYRILEMPEKQKAMVSAAIDSARKMKAKESYLEGYDIDITSYFEFPSIAESFATQLVRNGRFDVVDEFVQREGDPSTRVEMFAAAAKVWASQNAPESVDFMDKAEQEARKIKDDELRADALTKLASVCLRLSNRELAAHMLDEALGAARQLPEIYSSQTRRDFAAGKAEKLSAIALVLDRLGRTSDLSIVAHEAERVSRHIAEDPSYYLPQVAAAVARSGDYILARQVAERAVDGDNKLLTFSTVLEEIASRQDATVNRILQEPAKDADTSEY
jgi:hypothetical protein